MAYIHGNLDPVIGSEQGKTRPVLVISEEEINQILPYTIFRRQAPVQGYRSTNSQITL